MKIIVEPTVHLLSTPHFFPHPRYEIPAWATASEAVVAHAGKGCYDSYGADGRSIQAHIETLVKSGHGSVLEHANISLFIEGISRGCSHEIVRHRAGFAFSQRSTRYTDESEAAIVLSPYMARLYEHYEPADMMESELAESEFQLLDNFITKCQDDFEQYDTAVKLLMELNPEKLEKKDLRKWARGQARQLLPHALETRMTMTGNLRAWRHFIEQRSNSGAEDEIRRLAGHVYDKLASPAGNILGDYEAREIRGIREFTSTLKNKV